MNFHEIRRRLRARHAIRRDIARLARLDDRLLADMGVARGRIAALVSGEEEHRSA